MSIRQMRDISNANSIVTYLLCALCVEEWKANRAIRTKMSPAEYSRIGVGYSELGIQVWCYRHECNILHMDFEGRRHPANTTRQEPSK